MPSGSQRSRSSRRPGHGPGGRAAPALTALSLLAVAPGCALNSEDTPSDGAEEILGAVNRSFQNGVAPSSTYAGNVDTYLSQYHPTSNYGTAATCRIDGDDPNGTGRDLESLLKWTLSGIPAGSTIRAVTIQFNVTELTGSTYELYELKRSWSETGATWNGPTSTTSWASAGANGSTDRGTTVLGTLTSSTLGKRTVTLNAAGVALVQRWLNQPTTNFGIIALDRAAGDNVTFSSSEATTASLRPRLTVGYDPPVTVTDAGTATDSGTVAPTSLVVDDAVSVREGDTLVYAGRIPAATVARTLHIAVTRQTIANAATPDQRSMRSNLYAPGEYFANGTVFTRGVASMPLAANSAAIAEYAPTMPAQYLPDQFKSWLVTSINTEHYNIPTYVVDSTDPAQPYASFQSTDARVVNQPDLVRLTTGRIPLPTYGVPDSIGDRAMAIYDKGTGLMREYFNAVRQADGSWQFSASGIFQSNLWFGDLPSSNYWMQLSTGSSSVVGMLTPASQIGIAEARAGQINHALSVTFPNAARGVTSFPARQSDGTDANPNAPAEGQWFRIDPSVNIDALNLRPFTRVVAKAIQRYGGYGADKNLWCFAFNTEHPINETAAGRPNPWASGGDIALEYGSLDLNDFPWRLTQWAPVNWNGQSPDAAVVQRQNVVVEINGVATALAVSGGDVTLPSGANSFTIRVPTSTLNGFAQLDTVVTEASVTTGTTVVRESGSGRVTDRGN